MIVRGDKVAQAPGTLSAPGGKVEHSDDATGVLEEALRRVILEETGVTVGEMAYIRSTQFTMDTGELVIDISFLCQFKDGEAHVADPNEVAAVQWLTFEEIAAHPKAPPWAQETAKLAEALRLKLGW